MIIRAVNAPGRLFTSETSKRLIGILPSVMFASTPTRNGAMYQTVASSGILMKVGRTNLNATRQIPYAMKRPGSGSANASLIEGGMGRG